MSCEREGCNHGFVDHPDNGKCMKCDCVGFFRNSKVTDPVQEKYIQDTIDINVRFGNTLDLASHLNEDFPRMAQDFFHEVDKENDVLLKNLHDSDTESWIQVNSILHDYKTNRRLALKGASPKVLETITKLMHHGANYQMSLPFMREMTLSHIVIMFRTFLKEILTIMFDREPTSAQEWKGLNEDEKEKKVVNFAEQDIKEIGSELRKHFGIDIKSLPDWKEFAERFYRRDMYTHNRGFPNKKYRDRMNYNGSDVKLLIDQNYLSKTTEIFRKYAETITEFCLEKYMYVVNVKKKGNVTHVDLINDGGEIIPIENDDVL